MSVYELQEPLLSVESENDKHAATIRRILDTPGIQLNSRMCAWTHGEKIVTALHIACFEDIHSHVGAQLLLSDERCDVNVQDRPYGYTALMEAAQHVKSDGDMHHQIMRMLLNHPRIDVNVQWPNENGAIRIACNSDIQTALVAQMLQNDERCDVNLRDAQYNTALMIAAQNIKSDSDTHFQIVRLLLNHP